MAESVKKQREQRVPMRLPVRVRGMDLNGNLFHIDAHTVDITPVSARLKGFVKPLYRGMNIGVECEGRRARFRVVWVGQLDTNGYGEIGIRSLEPGRYIWGVPLKRYPHAEDVA